MPRAEDRFHESNTQRNQGVSKIARSIEKNVLVVLSFVVFAVLNCACIDRNHLHRVPAIRGRAVDALTGKPIVGLTLARWFEHNVGLGPGGSEDQQVEGSVVTVTSDADGRFEFPGGHSLWGIERLEWYAYKRGYMTPCE